MDVGSALKKNCVDDGVRLPLNRAGCGHRATLIGLLERAKLDDLQIAQSRMLRVTCGDTECEKQRAESSHTPNENKMSDSLPGRASLERK